MSKFFYNIADKNACFSITYKILVTRDTITKFNASIGWLQTRHNRLAEWNFFLLKWARKFAYLFVNDQFLWIFVGATVGKESKLRYRNDMYVKFITVCF